MIELQNVCKSFVDAGGKNVAALQHVSLEIAAGSVHVLIGTSGCGKTTTLRLVNRLEDPTTGMVRVAGEDVRQVDVIALRRRIGYVIQGAGLFPHMDVAQNIGVMCELESWAAKQVQGRVRELLTMVGLDPDRHASRFPGQLSGGQQQRVGIARALALDPDYLLMDEPFGALDPITRRQLIAELRPLFAHLGKTVLLVTHDLDEAFALGDLVTLMDAGRIVQTGSRTDFFERPANEFVERFVTGHQVSP